MTDLDPCEAAVARWLAHGVTSETHPVLRYALEAFFAPIGVEARAVEAEPFGALESGLIAWWLLEPKWNPALVERGSEAAKDFGYLLESPQSFQVAVTPQGAISFQRLSNDLAAEAFFSSSKEGWLAARHGLRAAAQAEAFLFGAAYLLLRNAPLASLYAAGDDSAFCAEVRKTIEG